MVAAFLLALTVSTLVAMLVVKRLDRARRDLEASAVRLRADRGPAHPPR